MPRFRRATSTWVYVLILALAGLWIGLHVSGTDITDIQNINLFHNLGVDVSTQKNVFGSWGEHLGIGSGWRPELEDRYASRPHLPSIVPLENGDEDLASDESAASGVNPDVMFEETRLKLSDTVFPVLDKSDSWSNENNKAIRDLFRCIELGNCVENQDKGVPCCFFSCKEIYRRPPTVVILGSYHFRGALTGWVGGEDMWSVLLSGIVRCLDIVLTHVCVIDRSRSTVRK